MKPSEIKERHEKATSFDRFDFFSIREGLTIHRVYKEDEDTFYLVFTTERIRESGMPHYRVAKFYTGSGRIWVDGYDSYASKYREMPTPEEAKTMTGKTKWMNGKKIYG